MNKSKSRLVDVKNFGGKETIIKGMVNHYKAVVSAKPIIDVQPPKPHVSKNNPNLKYNDVYLNVRHTYKGVASIKKIVDNEQPQTFLMGKRLTHVKQKELYEDMEHVRRLNAMSKRILAIGKKHERRKNIDDPISNPVYFFRKAGDDKATRLLSLDNYKEKLEEMNKEERNRMLLNEAVYNSLNPGKKTNERPKSAVNSKSLSNLKYDKKDVAAVTIDAKQLIHKYMTMKNDGTGKDFTKVLKSDLKDKSKSLQGRSKSAKLIRREKLLPFPLVDKAAQNFKDKFEVDCVRYIVQNRYYKDTDLNKFFAELAKRNKGLIEKKELDEITEKIKEELEN